MMVLCKPHYTRLCESDVKVKKVRIALFKLLFIEFLVWNYTGNREHYSMIYTGNIGGLWHAHREALHRVSAM
ncbi:hypothetical protein VEE70_33560 [Escherichia coli]|nr:hypothetical protein VEGS01_33520 [Escherichia coli]BEC20074.1 hypothetical protein VEE70_33560 [Escherichia coli]